MGDSAGTLIILGIVVLVIIWLVKGPSEKELEKRRREKEHDVKMTKLEMEKQRLSKHAENQNRAKKHKVFRAKHR